MSAGSSSDVAAPAGRAAGSGRQSRVAWVVTALVLLLFSALAVGAGVLAWNTQKRVKSLETELVKRQRDSSSEAAEARVLARQAETAARESSARVALMEARVAESTAQRSQIEELLQTLARSRDENVLAELESSIRVAQQQSAITGSAQPLVLVLKQADERLARIDQPRLERLRRAVAQDLEAVRNAGSVDIGSLAVRIDEVIRKVDDLPLLAVPEHRATERVQRTAGAQAGAVAGAPSSGAASSAVSGVASAASSARRPASAAARVSAASGAGTSASTSTTGSVAGAASGPASADEEGWRIGPWASHAASLWQRASAALWQEVRGLVRVTRIQQPDAVLIAPEQALFLRENLKLRLLNARLALLSRQFDLAQADLRTARADLDRYFDDSARRVQTASEALREVATQARQVQVPAPEATMAALAAAAVTAGR